MYNYFIRMLNHYIYHNFAAMRLSISYYRSSTKMTPLCGLRKLKEHSSDILVEIGTCQIIRCIAPTFW